MGDTTCAGCSLKAATSNKSTAAQSRCEPKTNYRKLIFLFGGLHKSPAFSFYQFFLIDASFLFLPPLFLRRCSFLLMLFSFVNAGNTLKPHFLSIFFFHFYRD